MFSSTPASEWLKLPSLLMMIRDLESTTVEILDSVLWKHRVGTQMSSDGSTVFLWFSAFRFLNLSLGSYHVMLRMN